MIVAGFLWLLLFGRSQHQGREIVIIFSATNFKLPQLKNLWKYKHKMVTKGLSLACSKCPTIVCRVCGVRGHGAYSRQCPRQATTNSAGPSTLIEQNQPAGQPPGCLVPSPPPLCQQSRYAQICGPVTFQSAPAPENLIIISKIKIIGPKNKTSCFGFGKVL